MKKFAVLFILLIATISLVAQTSRTWTGSTSTDWNTAGNWSPSGVPSSSDHIVLNNGSLTNMPLMDANHSITNITVSAGTLDLNGYTLTITGTTSLTGGTINSGTASFNNTTTTFAGTTFGAVVNASVSGISFNGSTFNSKVTVSKTGSSSSVSTGGNTFNDTLDISLSNGFMYMAHVSNDSYNGNVILSSTSSSTGITFGESTGNSTLASSKTITIGSGGFSVGTLSLKRFTQTGSTAQTLYLTSSANIVFGSSSTWNGKVSLTSPGVAFNGTTFNSKVTAVKNGSSTSVSNGGNTFNDTLDISLSNGFMYMAHVSNDSYNGNVILSSTSSSTGITFGESTGNATLASGKTISVGSAFSAGTLSLKRFTQTGSTAQTLSLTSSASIIFGGSSTWNGKLSVTAAGIVFNGTTFNGKVTASKTGSSANVSNGGNTFNDTLDISISNGLMYMTHVSNDNFNGNIILSSTNSSSGITFGESTGNATLASGKTITIGSGGFSVGTLSLKRFTQTGSTAQSLTLSGSTTFTTNNSTAFNGAFTVSAPNVLISASTFNSTLTVTKTSSSTNIWSAANTYNGDVSITNTGSGYINMSNVASGGDIYNANATFTKSGSGDVLIAGNASTVTFKGDVTLNNISSTQFTSSQVALFTGTSSQTLSQSGGTLTFGRVTINKASNNLTLSSPLTVSTALTLTSGKVITNSTNILNLADNATVSGASNSSYVQGPMKKTGNDAFTFPTGKSNYYRPIGIAAPTSTATIFTAEYLDANQTLGSTADTSIANLSDCEHWTLTRSGSSDNVNVTLSWNSASCNGAVATNMRVAGWNGSQWTNYGNGARTGTATTGTVTSGTTPTTFNAYTLGNKNCTGTATITPSGATSFCSGGSVNLSAPAGAKKYSWLPSGGTQTITASVSNSYIVKVADTLGCIGKDTVDVYVGTPPTVSVGGDKIIAIGEDVQLNAIASGGTTPYSYSWSPGTDLSSTTIYNPLASPNVLTEYIVTVTDDVGCVKRDTINVYTVEYRNTCTNADTCDHVFNGDFNNLVFPISNYILCNDEMVQPNPFDSLFVCYWYTVNTAINPPLCNIVSDDFEVSPQIAKEPNGNIFAWLWNDAKVVLGDTVYKSENIQSDIIPLVTGREYKFSFRYRLETAGQCQGTSPLSNNQQLDTLKVYITKNSDCGNIQTLALLPNIANAGWLCYTVCFEADTNYDQIRILPTDYTFDGRSSIVGVDDISITDKEETIVEVDASDTLVCFGDTVTLSPRLICFGWGYDACASILWSNGSTNKDTIMPIINDTTDFWYTISIGNCTYNSDTITIYPIPGPDSLQINGSAYACPDSGVYITYNASFYPIDSTAVYEWVALGGEIIGSDTSSTVQIDWGEVETIDTLIVTVCFNGINGCCDSDTLIIYPCCYADTSIADLIIYPGNYDKATTLIPYAVANGFGTGTNVRGVLYINGIFEIDSSMTFKGTDIYFGPNSSIVIDSAKTLTITNDNANYANLQAGCDVLWQGIYVTAPSCSLIVDHKTSIMDALFAVVGNNCNYISIDSSSFDRNYQGVIYQNCNLTPIGTIVPLSILNTTFDCSDTLLPIVSNGLSFAARSNVHINLSDCQEVQIGTNATQNAFSMADFGIYAFKTRLLVQGNTFINFNNDHFFYQGVGIYFNGNTTNNWLRVNQNNTFENCFVGIYAKNRSLVQVNNNNTFTNNIIGFYAHHIPNRNVRVIGATFEDNYISMLAEDMPNSVVHFGQNTITNSNTNYKHSGLGIIVQNPAPFKTGAKTNQNNIENLGTGVMYQNIAAGTPRIEQNDIIYNLSPTSMFASGYQYNGIYNDFVWPQSIHQNEIVNLNTDTVPGTNVSVFNGVYTLNSPTGKIDNNTLLRTGAGFSVQGYNLLTEYICNVFDSCNTSMMFIDTTVISDQRDKNIPAGNIFLNTRQTNLDGSVDSLNHTPVRYVFENGNALQDPGNGFTIPLWGIFVLPSSTDTADCYTLPDTLWQSWLRTDGQDMLFDAINDSIEFSTRNDLNNYLADNFAYLALKYVPDVLDSSSTFSDFFDDANSNPLGQLYYIADASFAEVDDTLKDITVADYVTVLQNAISDNNAITPTNSVESYRKFTYGIYLKALLREAPDWAENTVDRQQAIDDIFATDTTGMYLLNQAYGYRLTEEERDTLEAITTLNSDIYGDGVVTARVLVGFNFNPYLRLSNIIDEQPTSPVGSSSLVLYPNPTTGLVYAMINSEENGIFEIYDIQGKIIYSQVFKAGNAKIEANINSNANGLYLCRIIYDSGKREMGKLLLHQE